MVSTLHPQTSHLNRDITYFTVSKSLIHSQGRKDWLSLSPILQPLRTLHSLSPEQQAWGQEKACHVSIPSTLTVEWAHDLEVGRRVRWMSVLWSHSQSFSGPTPSISTLPFPLPFYLPLDFLSYSFKASQSSISELKSLLNHLFLCVKSYPLIVEWLHSGGQGENWEYGKDRRVWSVA